MREFGWDKNPGENSFARVDMCFQAERDHQLRYKYGNGLVEIKENAN